MPETTKNLDNLDTHTRTREYRTILYCPEQSETIPDVTDEDDLAAYLAGQQEFIAEIRPGDVFAYGQEAKQQRHSTSNSRRVGNLPEHHCAGCGLAHTPTATHAF